MLGAGGAARRLLRRRSAGTRRAPAPGPTRRRSTRIVRVAVHPSVGIARVGNSADSFFFGPELPGHPARRAGRLQGRQRRHRPPGGPVPRLRLRRRRATVVTELTAADGDDRLDGQRRQQEGRLVRLRHGDGHPGRRAGQPPQRTTSPAPTATGWSSPRASGRSAAPAPTPVPLDAGRFLDEPVPLGELITDELGRLVFLPADGQGYSPGQAPLTTFSDNDGWADDTCDGPVLATVTLGGRTLEADPGWVVVTPPNYGPGLVAGLVTGVRLVPARLGHVRRRRADRRATSASATTSSRSSGASSTCSGSTPGSSARTGGAATPTTSIPALLDRLADPSEASADAAPAASFEQFRNPDYATEQPDADPADVRRRRGHPGHVGVPVADRHADPVRPPAAWAAGTFTDDRDRAAADRPRRAAAGRADRSPSTGPASTPASAAPTTRASRCRGRCACRRCGRRRCGCGCARRRSRTPTTATS